MTRPHSSTPASALLVHLAAGVVLSVTLVLCGLHALLAINAMDHPETAGSVPAMLIAPLTIFAVGIALAGILEGLAKLINRPESETVPSVNNDRLTAVVMQMNSNLPGLFEELRQSIAQPIPASEMIEVPANESSPASSSTTDAHLEQMIKLLEEMKDLSMLDDTQRQQRRKQVMDRRKLSRLEEVARLAHHREWAQADSLLHLLESLHPGDADVLARRNELDDARVEIQTAEWEKLAEQVQDLLALSDYDQAIVVTTAFLDQFPGHSDCLALQQRVRREQAVFTDRRAGEAYDLIKASVEARQWRAALDGIQTFLEQFPEHPRAEKIRPQIRVIQKNAEIEERHDLEDQIRDLVAARRYAEAADMSEDLLQRFPESTQAAHLAEILPKLRERASAEVAGNVFLG